MPSPIPTRQDDTVTDYHGTLVADPYRWLEDAESAETLAWVEAQNRRTEDELRAIPARERIRARLTELWDYPRWSIPYREGERYYVFKNDGLQNQPVLYVRGSLDAAPVPVLDPNTLSADGTVALTYQYFTEDGRRMAYALSASGSDWQELRVRDVDAGTDAPEVLRWTKFASIAWTPDGRGFFYNRLPTPGSVAPEDQNNYSAIYWHTVGTPQEEDHIVYERPDNKQLRFYPTITEDGRYLVLTGTVGTDRRTLIYYREVGAEGDFTPLLDEMDAAYAVVANDGPVFYVQTDLDAPRGRIVAIDTRQPGREHWREVIHEGDETLAYTGCVAERFVVISLRDASHRVRLYAMDGTFECEIELPTLGSIEGLSGKRAHRELFLQFTSFLYPSTPLQYDFETGELSALHEPAVDFDAAAYETRQLFATSRDGTRVPVFVTHNRGLALDGQNPTLLYAYGGFNISLTPGFSIARLPWLEAGGVYASATLRGGGEYGEEWHQGGMLERKQNVFDDFIAAAEHLIAQGYTSTPKLAIEGGSNGGLLVGACLTQRPELYGAVVCEVPVVDMLRYHTFTVGHFWIPEYGDAETNPEHFRFLYAYSPLHNVHTGTAYPPTLITSADSDDRVVPAHAKKFAATLQAAQGGDAPILLRVETKAGHGQGKPISKQIEEHTDVYAFLWEVLGM